MSRFWIICLMGFLLIGCETISTANHKNNSTVSTQSNVQSQQKINEQATEEAKKPLTIQQLKKKVKEKILKITRYETYALVESENSYQFFNLKTGESFYLPVGVDNIKSYHIIDKDHIRFLADGTNRIGATHVLPYYFDCIRVEPDGPFARHDIKTYYPLNNALEFGGKPGEVVSDIRTTLDGLQVLFTPQKGNEAEFFADDTMNPVTTTYYNQKNNTFIIEFKATQLAKEVNKINVRPNDFIKSVKTKDIGQDVQIILELKSDAEVYSGMVGHLNIKNNLPYVTFAFSRKSNVEAYGASVVDLSGS